MDLKTKLKRLSFIRALPYEDLLQAHKLIERGCDHPLLFLWYNLFKTHYYPVCSLEKVNDTVQLYIDRYPEFASDIKKWFESYTNKIKAIHEAKSNAKIAYGERYCRNSIPGR